MHAFLSYLFTVKMDAQILYLGLSRMVHRLGRTSLIPRLSPRTATTKSKEGESLVPFCMWCAAQQHHCF